MIQASFFLTKWLGVFLKRGWSQEGLSCDLKLTHSAPPLTSSEGTGAGDWANNWSSRQDKAAIQIHTPRSWRASRLENMSGVGGWHAPSPQAQKLWAWALLDLTQFWLFIRILYHILDGNLVNTGTVPHSSESHYSNFVNQTGEPGNTQFLAKPTQVWATWGCAACSWRLQCDTVLWAWALLPRGLH